MSQLLVLAHLIAALLGHDFDQEWACWSNNPAWTPRAPVAHVCEYTNDNGLTITLTQDWDVVYLPLITK